MTVLDDLETNLAENDAGYVVLLREHAEALIHVARVLQGICASRHDDVLEEDEGHEARLALAPLLKEDV
jgi:hypothetical protein